MGRSLTRAKAQRCKGALPQKSFSPQKGTRSTRDFSEFLCLCVIARVLLLLLCFAGASFAQTKRLVVIQCDGLPYDVVDHFVKQRDPQSGKSLLPWIDYIFY